MSDDIINKILEDLQIIKNKQIDIVLEVSALTRAYENHRKHNKYNFKATLECIDSIELKLKKSGI